MSQHFRHVTPRGVLAYAPRSPSLTELIRAEVNLAFARFAASASSLAPAPTPAAEPAPKPRSRRCFVCGRTDSHALDFRVCPRTHVLLRRSLARYNDDGRLVCFDGSPLPMTRHPGGVAAHLISRANNASPSARHPPPPAPVLLPRELPLPPRATPDVRAPHHVRLDPPAPTNHPSSPHANPPRVRVDPPAPTIPRSSPHANPPVPRSPPAPAQIPHQLFLPAKKYSPRPPDDLHGAARRFFLTTLLESLINVSFRYVLLDIIAAVINLSAQYPYTLREKLEPVFWKLAR
ncbi:hypothetical protein R3P38DRAFT_2587014 [Favolaschia claudopus]|uniref:Uncharacterized protein n=1 Tax=Favolaschia claudopus TaxID=2862362 RepID=A0AAV9Z4T8_9AGAR